jgi:hypothetical protein
MANPQKENGYTAIANEQMNWLKLFNEYVFLGINGGFYGLLYGLHMDGTRKLLLYRLQLLKNSQE